MERNIQITKAQELEICQMYQSGLTKKQITNKLRINVRKVNFSLKNAGIAARRAQISEAQRAEIVKYYTEDNLSSEKIAKLVNVSSSGALRILKECGVQIKKPDFYTLISKEQEGEILKVYSETESLLETHRITGVSILFVRRHLKSLGLKLKNEGQKKTNVTPEMELEIIKRYVQERVASDKVCREFKIRQNRFYDILNKYGHETREPNDTRRVYLTESQKEEIVELAKQGNNTVAIKRKLSFICDGKRITTLIRSYFKLKGKNHYEKWNIVYGKEKADEMTEELKRRQSVNASGENNPMFGKPSPQGSGNGWNGWYKEFYFRSLRELSYLLDLDEKQIPWSSGEAHKFDIPYVNYKGTKRTYRPDFLVNKEKLVEIKPKRLQKTPTIMAKAAAAIEKCKEWGLTYEILDFKIDAVKVEKALNEGLVRFARDYEKRFRDYIVRVKPVKASC